VSQVPPERVAAEAVQLSDAWSFVEARPKSIWYRSGFKTAFWGWRFGRRLSPGLVASSAGADPHARLRHAGHQGKNIACHERSFGRHQKVLNLEHYLDALSRKPGAFAGSTPLKQWRAQGRWPASFDRFWEASKQRRGKQDGTRAMIDLLIVGRDRG